MNNNQINGQKNNKEAYCPNPIFNNGTVSIGEFKTIEDAMNFPMQEIWCINRTQDNKFNSYVSQGCRLLIICDWGKSIQDSQKFVVALISKSGKITYWDLNDLPINTRQYENSIDNDVLTAIYAVADELYRNNNQLNCNTNMNKKLIRLTESDLHRIVKESVNRILNEDYFDDNNFGRFHAIDDKGKSAMEVLDAIHNKKGMGAIGRQTPQQHWDMQRDAISAEKQRESDKRNRMKTKASDRRWMKAADSRPLHRKESLNRIGVTEVSSYDMLKYDTIQKYGNDDPMNLSDSELRSRIEYMLAYRWALEGQEYILDDYMEEARSRGI